MDQSLIAAPTSGNRPQSRVVQRAASSRIPARPLGQHLLVDYVDCESLPSKPETLKELLETAAKLIGATVVQSVFHQFNPYGLSGVVVIAESHLAVHTWPENNTACVDFFTCDESMDAEPGIAFLAEQFDAGQYTTTDVARGNSRDGDRWSSSNAR